MYCKSKNISVYTNVLTKLNIKCYINVYKIKIMNKRFILI